MTDVAGTSRRKSSTLSTNISLTRKLSGRNVVRAARLHVARSKNAGSAQRRKDAPRTPSILVGGRHLWLLGSSNLRFVGAAPSRLCRRIGDDVWFSLMLQHDPDPTEIPLLGAHARSTAKRGHEQEVARKEHEEHERVRRWMRAEQ